MTTKACPICNELINYNVGERDVYFFQCPRCGSYKFTYKALKLIENNIDFTFRQKANISGWLLENQSYEITTKNLDSLKDIINPTFHDRADKILIALQKETDYAGKFLERNSSWLSHGWCINDDELNEILEYLESLNRIDKKVQDSKVLYKILPNGWAHLEELKKINTDSQQGFVAMWFDESMKKIYEEAIAPAISDAGYYPHRVDQREHNDSIDDEIIAQIRRSRFVVADFTGHRGGVYYEAGFAKGLGLEVFWTCKKDDIKNLHFDIRQYNCIDWEETENYKKRLTYRIESVLGHGSYKPEK